jgi:protein-disulfide isomerase-like protein with CxxC motif
MKDNTQREILQRLANKYGIGIMQAEEIFHLFGQFISQTIGQERRTEDGLYDIESFPVIHIDHFGKFIPNKMKLHHANKNLPKKKK